MSLYKLKNTSSTTIHTCNVDLAQNESVVFYDDTNILNCRKYWLKNDMTTTTVPKALAEGTLEFYIDTTLQSLDAFWVAYNTVVKPKLDLIFHLSDTGLLQVRKVGTLKIWKVQLTEDV